MLCGRRSVGTLAQSLYICLEGKGHVSENQAHL